MVRFFNDWVLENTGFEGFGYSVASTNRCLKWFWFSITSFAFLAVIYQVTSAITSYFENHVSTAFQVIPYYELNLPGVVICGPTKFDARWISQKGVNASLMTDYSDLLFPISAMSHKYSTHMAEIRTAEGARRIFETYDPLFEEELRHLGNYDTQRFIEEASFTCENIVAACSVGGYRRSNCCESALPIYTSFGRCYQIPGTKQYLGGSESNMGLQFLFRVPENRFELAAPGTAWNDGLIVRFINPLSDELESGYTTLPMGYLTTIEMEGTYFKFLVRDTFPCTMDDKYKSDICQFKCSFEMIMGYCGCAPADLWDVYEKDFPLCTRYEAVSCFLDQVRNLTDRWEKMSKRCRGRCKPTCNRIEFRKTFSAIELSDKAPPRGWFRQGDWQENTASLNMYYPKMEMTVIEQAHQMTFEDLVGTIGGILGYWVGGSLLTVINTCIVLMFYGWKDRDENGNVIDKSKENAVDLKKEMADDEFDMPEKFKVDFRDAGKY